MPAPYRLGFTDPRLKDLYRDLTQQGVTEAALDQGCVATDYGRMQSTPLAGAGDNFLQSCELFNDEVMRGPLFPSVYRKYSGGNLPWLPTIENPVTKEMLQRFDQDIARWKREHPGEKDLVLAQYVYEWVTSGEGLAMQVVTTNAERNFDEAIGASEADCSDFFKLLYALFTRAGFSPYPLWVKIDRDGNEANHFATGLDIDGRTYLVDPYYRSFNAEHRLFARISMREVLGWHWINLAQDLISKNSFEAAAEAYQRAFQMDPANPHLYYNRGLFKYNRGILEKSRKQLQDARQNFLEVVKLDPNFNQAHCLLGDLAYNVKNFREAVFHYRRGVELLSTDFENPNCQKMLELSLCHLGQSKKTREECRRLAPIDSE